MQINGASYVAEFIGTFFFILAIFASGGNPVVIGLLLAVVVFLTDALSGGHINPAVSFAMFLNGSLTVPELVSYICAQLLGGASAFYTYKSITVPKN